MFKSRKKKQKKALNDPSLNRVKLTPQMLDYDRFANRSISQYLPYVMYFNPPNFKSAAINTDALGFRFSHTLDGSAISVDSHASLASESSVNLLVGGSASLGYGSTSDSTSLASCLAAIDPDETPWINFSGHIFNSIQELLLFILHSHKLPPIKRIVIMGGFNALVMARLPEFDRGELPPFFYCGEYYNKFDEIAETNGATLPPANHPKWPAETTAVPPIDETLERGVTETLKRLRMWNLISKSLGAQLVFLQQPLSTWVRDPCSEEKSLFDELDSISNFGTWEGLYGDISNKQVGENYGHMLAKGCDEMDIPFGSLVYDLRELPSDDWLYVDRAHFTDHGNEAVASAIHKHILNTPD